jgi:ABC-type amino acid transport substrate-binding protein
MTKSFLVLMTAVLWWCAAASPLVAAGEPASKRPRPQVTFLGSEDNPPFLSRDESGKPSGFTVEFMEALADEGNFDVTFELVPREIRRQEFQRGRGQVTGVQTGTPEAKGTLTLAPLWQVQQLLLFATPRPAGVSLADQRGERVAVMAASNQHLALNVMPADRLK